MKDKQFNFGKTPSWSKQKTYTSDCRKCDFYDSHHIERGINSGHAYLCTCEERGNQYAVGIGGYDRRANCEWFKITWIDKVFYKICKFFGFIEVP